LWEDSQQEVWSASQINDFLRSILSLASIKLLNMTCTLALPFFVLPEKMSRDSDWNTHLKFYDFGDWHRSFGALLTALKADIPGIMT